jgi:hypothetical protein
MTKEPNAIETKNQMNCRTCSFEGRCRFVKDIHYSYRKNMICRYYSNPEKGCYTTKADERKVT